MKRHLRNFIVAASLLGAVGAIITAQTTSKDVAKERPKAGPVIRRADGKPDITGYWQAGQPHAFWAAFDLEGRAVADIEIRTTFPTFVVDPANGKIPYNEPGMAKKKDLYEHHLREDPQAHCFLSGVPRQIYTPFGFQILQAQDAVLFSFEAFHAYRNVYTSGKHPDPKIKLFQGDSRGKWEGDVFVVETDNLNDRTWFDMGGNFHGNNLKVVERFAPVDADTITYTATMTEPENFTQPWTIKLPLTRNTEKDYETLEYACVEGEQDLQHYTEGAGGTQK
jgi:hypothetical protein